MLTAVILAAVLVVSVIGLPRAEASTWPTVEQGASGPNVTSLQHLLNHHGPDIPADGEFGPVTRDAVIAFQRAKDLTVDGIVGPQTWSALIVTVRQGSTGHAVRAAQVQLNKWGAGLAVDGQFGQLTANAVLSFQTQQGLARDGVVGPATWQALVGGSGGGGSYRLPLDRNALPRSAYGAPHWNSTPAVDLMVSYLPTYAVATGTADHFSSTSCGIGMRLLVGNGTRFVYCHLSARSVADGAPVSPGTRLGTTGDTGNSGAPHLHIQLITGDDRSRCPQQWLLAVYDGVQPPAYTSLPTSGCTG
ncbi:MAG: peptidoglycan-binding protein [Micromonosporaceae bacterium]